MRGRKRSYSGPGTSRESHRARRGEREVDFEMIHHMEAEAYHAILNAFSAQSDSVSWERVALMTKLRQELNITDEEHGELLVKIREWRNSNSTAIKEFGNVDKRHGLIQIGATDQIIHEVERLLNSRGVLSPAQLEEAKLVLQEHERAILEALDQLAIDEAAAGA